MLSPLNQTLGTGTDTVFCHSEIGSRAATRNGTDRQLRSNTCQGCQDDSNRDGEISLDILQSMDISKQNQAPQSRISAFWSSTSVFRFVCMFVFVPLTCSSLYLSSCPPASLCRILFYLFVYLYLCMIVRSRVHCTSSLPSVQTCMYVRPSVLLSVCPLGDIA